MKRKSIGKRILAVLLALALVNPGMNYAGAVPVYAQTGQEAAEETKEEAAVSENTPEVKEETVSENISETSEETVSESAVDENKTSLGEEAPTGGAELTVDDVASVTTGSGSETVITYYESINEAWNAAADINGASTITLLKDCTASQNMILKTEEWKSSGYIDQSSTDITLALGKNTLFCSSNYISIGAGKLSITSGEHGGISSSNEGGVIEVIITDAPTYGTVSINGGTYTNDTGCAVYENGGTLNISGGLFKGAPYGLAVESVVNCSLSGGAFEGILFKSESITTDMIVADQHYFQNKQNGVIKIESGSSGSSDKKISESVTVKEGTPPESGVFVENWYCTRTFPTIDDTLAWFAANQSHSENLTVRLNSDVTYTGNSDWFIREDTQLKLGSYRLNMGSHGIQVSSNSMSLNADTQVGNIISTGTTITVENNGTLRVDSGTITGGEAAIVRNGGTVTLYGGTFQNSVEGRLVLKNNVLGENLNNWHISTRYYYAGGDTNGDIVKGDVSELKQTVTVGPKVVATLTKGSSRTGYSYFPSAIEAAQKPENAGCTVSLRMNVTTGEGMTASEGTFTIDLNGHEWKTGEVWEMADMLVIDGASVTIKDSGQEGTMKYGRELPFNVISVASGYLNIEGGNFTGSECVSNMIFSSIPDTSNGKVTITGGKFSGGDNAILQNGAPGTLEIKGGTFYRQFTNSSIKMNSQDRQVGELLADGYTCYSTDDDGGYIPVNVQSVTNVKIVPIPLSIEQEPAAPKERTYGYTDTQDLTVLAEMAEGITGDISYQWYQDGTEYENRVGTNSNTYTIPTGLPSGNHEYVCVVSYDGYEAATKPVTFAVHKTAGTVAASPSTPYETEYIGNGAMITAPVSANFVTNSGSTDFTFTWYKDSATEANKLADGSRPVEIGAYILRVDAAETENYTTATGDFKVFVYDTTRAALTAATSIIYDGDPVAEGETGDIRLDRDGSSGTVTYSYKKQGAADFTEGLPVEVGAYTVQAKLGSDQVNLKAPAVASCELTIAKAEARYSVAAQHVMNGSTLEAIQTMDAAKGVKNEDLPGTIAWSETENGTLLDAYTFSGAGGETKVLYYHFTPESGNYKTVTGAVTFTITTKKIPTLAVTDYAKLYNGKAVTSSDIYGTAMYDGKQIAGMFSFTEGTVQMMNAGSYQPIIEFTPKNQKDYEKATIQGNVIILRRAAAVSVILNKTTLVSGTALPTAGIDYQGLFGQESLIGTLTPEFTGMPADSNTAGSYTVTWSNMDAMKAEISAMPVAANYDITYTATAAFTIEAAKEGMWAVEIADQTYTGKALKPEVVVYDGNIRLQRGKDYTVSYKNNKNVKDTPIVIIKGKGSHRNAAKIETSFRILPAELSNSKITTSAMNYTYNGKEIKKIPAVKLNGKKLKNKTDFAVTYPSLGAGAYKEAGSYDVVITGTGNYTGILTLNEYIAPKGRLLSNAKTLKLAKRVYTGNPLTVKGGNLNVTMKVKGKSVSLKEGEDYTISYKDNVEIGTAKIILTGTGKGAEGFYGSKTLTFQITGTSIKKARVSGIENAIFDGEEKQQDKLTLTCTKGGEAVTLREGCDYKVSYSNNFFKGTAKLTITGIGAYFGSVNKTFKISLGTVLGD